MRVRLPGLNTVRNRKTGQAYYYFGKGGPRIHGEPGTPEFLENYRKAEVAAGKTTAGTVQHILNEWQRTPRFQALAPSTRRQYIESVIVIERTFGTMPIAALADKRARGVFLAWRDSMSATPRTADIRLRTLSVALNHAVDRGWLDRNPVAKPGRLHNVTRADKTWTDADLAAFHASAPDHLRLALTLALHTGQRQGDLLRLTWAQYDGRYIRLTQQKTGARVVIPATAELRAILDERRGPANDTILTTQRGQRAWTSDGFRASWNQAMKDAGVTGVTFHDLRGTAVTRLSVAGCTPQEIGTITGHSLSHVNAIIDSHYLKRDTALADSAIRKLEESQTLPKSGLGGNIKSDGKR
ncbi:integrase [Acetobacter estunensis NRIC 0472]|uniref:Tyrosine-type recombinase/integrase n=1 Tax=Acetobacter estunensis TaxID=104097 RepID=A0A967EDP1_9PROT|nr:tyrosine-type recombinase/integrase [Acetobacter estunensis]NHO54220.1 tyrosine-type recombinase/integrase [Acetobacter estunensis]GBQ24329.1 integrase [Acetobacter estunensis NRIC 0472]